jgi:hypothetical protein
VLVDLDHSTLVAVALSVGGYLGTGERRFAVPVNQIEVGPEARLTADLTKEQNINALTGCPAADWLRN